MSDGTRAEWANPARPIRKGLAILGIFVATIVGWSVFAPLSDAAIAVGRLEVEGRRQSVQNPYGGVIRDLRVSEGEAVTEGQVLATLADTRVQSQLDVLLTEQAGLLAKRARLVAERDTTAPEFGPLPDRVTEAAQQAVTSEIAMLDARNRSHAASLDVMERQRDRLGEVIVGTRSEVDALKNQLDLGEQELDDAQTLMQRGLTTRPRLLGLEREVSRIQSMLAAKTAEVASAEQSIAEAEAGLARLDRDRLADVAQQLNAVETRLSEIRPSITAAEEALERKQVRAPASGRVVGLSVFTEGGVVEPGAPMMEIVPSDAAFFVDARLAPTDLHGIASGQDAEIELLSLPRNIRPELRGEVTNLSPDRLTDERTGEAYYSVQLSIEGDMQAVDMQAGMPVQVILPTRDRTLIDYLTSPLFDQLGTAFREY